MSEEMQDFVKKRAESQTDSPFPQGGPGLQVPDKAPRPSPREMPPELRLPESDLEEVLRKQKELDEKRDRGETPNIDDEAADD